MGDIRRKLRSAQGCPTSNLGVNQVADMRRPYEAGNW